MVEELPVQRYVIQEMTSPEVGEKSRFGLNALNL
jgi:hypothetical protein